MSIRAEHLTYLYGEGTAFEQYALKDVSFEIGDGEFIGLIGHTGSGKSTLIQHLNGLLRASSGKIYYNGEDIDQEGYDRRNLRSKVGLVFQYPEHQLFEVDVLSDVCFGPKNQGLSREEAQVRAKEALMQVGLEERFWDQSPFELSGGQKRRVAIAGVLAMQPEVLILDEPTAGLDPRGRDEILEEIAGLHRDKGMTIVLVSHSMEDIARYADRILVMNHGEKRFDGPPREVFGHYKELEEMGLAAPQITYVVQKLREHGVLIPEDITTVEEAKDGILRLLKSEKAKWSGGQIVGKAGNGE
ncbi:energy-coupling factor transporter ATPase [Candidatus Ventrimonas sp. KK005]|nr:energy-coupling factor transporter ATPase [Lachnospiraceae bacterium]NBH17007.1 energy-coupling factor transporter ATPase [Clostridiaceae bacterium]